MSSSSSSWTTFPSIHITATVTQGQSGVSDSFTFQGDPAWTETATTTTPTGPASVSVSSRVSSSVSSSSAAPPDVATKTTVAVTTISLPPSSSSSSVLSSPPSPTPSGIKNGHPHASVPVFMIAVPTIIVGLLLLLLGCVLLWRRLSPRSFDRFWVSYIKMPRFRLRSRFPWLVVRRRSGDADDEDSEDDDRGLLASLPLRAVRRVRSFFSRRPNNSTTTDPFADPLPPTFNDRYEHHLRKFEAEAARAREKYSFDTEPLPLTPASKRRQRRRNTSLFTNTSSPNSSTPWRNGHNANTDSPGGGIKLSRLMPRTPKTPTRKGKGKGKNKNTDADDAEEEARREKRRRNVHERIYGRYNPDNDDDDDDDHISLESWEEIWFNLGNDSPAKTNANASAAGPSGITNADRINTGRDDGGDASNGSGNTNTIERLASVDETQEPAEEERPHTLARQMQPQVEEEKGKGGDADNTTTNTTGAPTPPPTTPATMSGDDDTTPSHDEGPIQDFNANITTGPGQSWRKLV